ncbi:MAG TPA: hypothetical protein PKD85_13820, partial [Saprospiraceae bacterium]|nr:hypothetical protein [Saprospiraceae bacterium]
MNFSIRILNTLTLCFLVLVSFSQDKTSLKKPMTWKDIPNWKSINTNSMQLSNDGSWYAYSMGAVEGDADLFIHKMDSISIKKSYPIGGAGSNFKFSENSQWLAFMKYPNF